MAVLPVSAITPHNEPNHHEDDVQEQLFQELFREYEHRLYVFVMKVLRSDATAKDIIQDVFLKLWTIRNQLTEIENINAFLYRLTENRVYDHLRAAATRQEHRQKLWQQLQKSLHTETEMLEKKEFHGIIREAINQLPPQRKTVYLLNKNEGLKQKEIAEKLQLSPNTVRNHLAEAIRQIGSYVKKNINGFFSFLL
ncbi:RNA polymerase sigma-70 factor [Pseudoflavitalea sp. G-6-1-2]|uniref:RNA polymerase sigma-70 factor n=1 Tax=Pseudoflavitalea sp. G-6-1-2 TaxID=2728841 RepID=UPI00146B0963|nr:RNA polymerase sigma-70 factor [Pseudoflavitalea sp. G-6-1-2]NML21747.1 RNA polymerase sigma-70 factor [Pseudoflavitalea sp. G-6-1-2]